MFRETAGRRGEQSAVHNLKIRGDRRMKIHMRQDVALKIDAGGDFRQHRSFRAQFENRPFGDVMHGLSFGAGQFAVVRNLVYPGDEFTHLAFAADMQRPVFTGDLQPFGGKEEQNTTWRAFWVISIKPPAPGQDAPSRVALTCPCGSISPAPIKVMSTPAPL